MCVAGGCWCGRWLLAATDWLLQSLFSVGLFCPPIFTLIIQLVSGYGVPEGSFVRSFVCLFVVGNARGAAGMLRGHRIAANQSSGLFLDHLWPPHFIGAPLLFPARHQSVHSALLSTSRPKVDCHLCSSPHSCISTHSLRWCGWLWLVVVDGVMCTVSRIWSWTICSNREYFERRRPQPKRISAESSSG